ncbi:PREDICTED: serine/threonine-protein kinase 10-like [Ipomoea nil]|uniref:serine/threonine-protein kinase 10-like n=1 Tax=Ipomoea nil TaxID=35883 RepID=UPI000900DE6A|nr:PREDICTED: serine/threonine-protein kinase 10-like [Ipomoea nil]
MHKPLLNPTVNIPTSSLQHCLPVCHEISGEELLRSEMATTDINEARRRNYLINLDSQMVYKIISDDPIGRDSGNIPVYKVTHSALHGTKVTFNPHDFLCVKKANLRRRETNSSTTPPLDEEISTRNNALPHHHKNLMPVDAHFVDKLSEDLCVVMPFPERGSLRSIMADEFPYGFPEVFISVALRSVLKALRFLHGAEILHGDVNAGHVYVKSGPKIMLGFAATVYEHQVSNVECSSHSALPATQISTWAAAPEVYDGGNGNKAADIWLVGITAMELAYGGIRVPNREALEVLIRGIIETKRLPKNYQLEEEGEEKRSFSREFEKMVAECVAWNPADRPSACTLLKHEFFSRRIRGLKRSTFKSHFQQVVIDEKIENSNTNSSSRSPSPSSSSLGFWSSPDVNKRRVKSHISIPGRPESFDNVFDDEPLNLNFNFPSSLQFYNDIIKEVSPKLRFYKTPKRKLFDDDLPAGLHEELIDEYIGGDEWKLTLGRKNKKVTLKKKKDEIKEDK